jgi:hypothetical protein
MLIAATALTTWRNWMLAHSRPIMLIVLVLIGAAVPARGAFDLNA